MSIETSTRCSCGTYVVLSEGSRYHPHGGWDARCPDCYGPVEDSSPVEKVLGWGKTPAEALADWQEKHDEAWEVEWLPRDLFGDIAAQVSEEAERQSGWVNHYELNYACETCAIHYGPVTP